MSTVNRRFVRALVAVAPLAAPASGPVLAHPAPAAGEARPVAAARPVADPSSRWADERLVDPEVRWLRSVLVSPAGDAAMRRGAAERLLQIRGDDGRTRADAAEVLAQVLRGGDEAARAAVLEAVTQASDAPASLALPMVELVRATRPENREHISAALARLESSAVAQVAPLAASHDAEHSLRCAAVWSLGALRDRAATQALIDLLAPDRHEPPELVAEVCATLEALFPAGIGNAPERWREWWSALRERGGDPEVEHLVQTLRSKVADLEAERSRLTKQVNDVATRLAAAYAEQFLTLPLEQRQERTLRLLEDSLAPVRAFGLTQVDRMIRNGEVPSEALQQALLGRLEDVDASTRLRALRLLEDIGRPHLAAEVAPAFERERDPEVVKAYLDFFQRRPAPQVLDRLIALLDGPDAAGEAARAILRVSEIQPLPPEAKTRALELARSHFDRAPSAAFARLLAVVGDPSDLDRIEPLLGSEDVALRRGAADALRQGGRLDLLLQMQDDEAVYPALVRGLAEASAIPPLEGLRQVLALAPPTPELAADRVTAVRKLSERMAPADLLAADDLLAAADWADCAFRAELLAPVMQASEQPAGGEVSPGQRRAVLLRLARLLVEAGDGRRALAVTERIRERTADAEGAPDAELDEVRFAACAVDGQYELAAGIHPSPGPWIDLLTEVWGRRGAAAAPLRDEIDRRFGQRLDEADSARFERLSSLIVESLRNGAATGSPGSPTERG